MHLAMIDHASLFIPSSIGCLMAILLNMNVESTNCCGSKIFSTFIAFLKCKDPSDETEQALLNELNSFDNYFKENVRPLS